MSRLRDLLGRTWRRQRAAAPGRLPLALLLGVCLVAVTAAISGASPSVPGLRFAQAGHWVASPDLGAVFHVNGAARSVDAQVQLDGIERDSQVVQGETSGYVVGRARIVEFGKSNLSVERTITPKTGERPVAVETAGGPYLIYREAGSVVRLGADAAVVPAGGALGEPVATPDGTLWLHRPDSGAICSLRVGADQISCPAVAPPGHSGALTVVGGRPVFVDTVADTMSPVTDDGLGEAAPIGADLPAGIRVAPVDVAGRVAILDPAAPRMYLAEAANLGAGRQESVPVDVPLSAGVYSAPSATGSSVVLLELSRNSVLTYSSTGEQQRVVAVPKEAGEPRLHRGEDGRVYVDGAEGRHVMVVDPTGGVGSVPVGGSDGPNRPATPWPDGAGDTPGGPARPSGDGRQGPPSAPEPRRSDPPATAPKPPPAPPVPASPPGMPRNLRASASGANVTVTWGAATANGAGVRAYRVTWARTSGGGAGSVIQSGSARSASLTDLTRGAAYQVSVVAENSAGRGSPATVRVTVPAPARTVAVSRGADTTHGTDCTTPNCAFMRVVLRGFAPNTSYKIQPYSSGNYSNPGARLTTDGNGNLTTERFAFGSVGESVWVTVDGVTSNRYRWPAG